MKKFLIKSFTDIYEDNYIDGEGKHINCYYTEGEIEANCIKEAIKTFLSKYLCFTNGYFDKENATYENVVDAENVEIDVRDKTILEKFKNNEVVLYNSYTHLRIFELNEVRCI